MLSFLLLSHNDGPRLRLTCQSLATALRPGDQVVVVDAGSTDHSPERLRRFLAEQGWGQDITHELVCLPTPPDGGPGRWAEIARSRATNPWCISLTGQDLVQTDAVQALRARLKHTDADLLLANRAWWLAGPCSALACPDAGRWPDTDLPDIEKASSAALRLMPDPRRLVMSAEFITRNALTLPGPDAAPGALWDAYDAAVKAARRIAFLSQPIVLSPLPQSDPFAGLAVATARLTSIADPRATADPSRIAAALDMLGDQAALLDPPGALRFLESLAQILRALPRRLRHHACAHDGPVGPLLSALHKGGIAAAMPHLTAQFAAQDRARTQALTAEIAQLREDVDLALPGPEYLIRLNEWVRRP